MSSTASASGPAPLSVVPSSVFFTMELGKQDLSSGGSAGMSVLRTEDIRP